MTSFWSIGKII